MGDLPAPRARPGRGALVVTILTLVALAAYGWMADVATRRESFGWEREVFRALYDGDSPWPYGGAPREDPLFETALPFLFRVAGAPFLALLVVSIIAVVVVARRPRGVMFLAGALVLNALNPLLKELYERPSPFPLPGDHSFPSGHALAAASIVAAAVALAWRTRLRGVVTVVGASYLVAAGIPVVADAGHWPTDVIAAWILAAAWVVTLTLAFRDPLGPRRDRPAPDRA